MADRRPSRVGGVPGALIKSPAEVGGPRRPKKDTKVAPRALVASRRAAIIPWVNTAREKGRAPAARPGSGLERQTVVIVSPFSPVATSLAAEGEMVTETIPGEFQRSVPVTVSGTPLRRVHGCRAPRGARRAGGVPINAVAMEPAPVVARVGVA